MLAGLARWLRAAGYDTAVAEGGACDRALVDRAAAEGRVFLTRDRSVPQLKTRAPVWVIEGAGADAEARELSRRGVDWTAAPFTRCLVDNTPLETARPQDMLRMPEESRLMPGPHQVCPGCRRVYWPGSHVRRMRAQLERWAAG
jgi:uncharacterized protein